MFAFALRLLLGVFVGWALLGALIGPVAALWRRVPASVGIFVWALLGPLAFLLFYTVRGQDFRPHPRYFH